MKKLTKKLSLNKQTISALNSAELKNLKGGLFTYSLSTGDICIESKARGANNGYECGKTAD